MTNIDYSKFTSEDFLKDTYFLKSIKTPTKESNAFWKEQLLTEKIREKEFRVAKNIILSANIPHHTISEEELSELWNKIEKFNKQKPLQRHSRLIQFASVAASFAILVALSYTFWSKQSNNGSSLISIAKSMQVQGDSSAVQLILNNDKNITLDQENVTIEYNATGDVIVNKQQVAHNIASNTNGPAQLSETNTYNQLIVPKGKRSSIVFGDGTKLWVNSGSRIVYPISFKKDKREIYVEGEVYLEVTKDKSRPFIVSTNKMNIAVLGTSFNVTAYTTDKEQSVVLVTGAVEVNTDSNKKIALTPNNRLTYTGGQLDVENVDASLYVSWVEGLYIYNSEKLGTILDRLSRYYGKTITYDARVSELRCSGKLDMKDELLDVLAGLAQTAPITWQYNEIENELCITYK
ncbi:FecR family protein [Macellibacteroides fermentans]|uniref:FecR family protein n=1 Tax=Parabacteroides chartae TaxID=1037355 RepID=A0A1T5DZ88_9BACT|nr:FecR family protein [Parabacteroides chartae]SKB76889.1 FecR family protein [Parabacteroides chartae]